MILMTLIDTPDKRDLFDVLYEKYKRLMFKIAMDVLNEPFLAEDAVHDTFIKLAGRMDMVDDADSRRTMRLLVTMTKNTAIDIYRRNSKLFEREISVEDYDECGDAVISFDCDPEDDVPEILASLPPIYRDVFLLKYSALYENNEIARILDIPEGTVRQRIARGKALIRKQLSGRRDKGSKWQEQAGT